MPGRTTVQRRRQAVAGEADGWPVLGDDAYHGLAGDDRRAIAPETEADPAGVLLSLLSGVGNAVGRTPYFVAGADTHHANLFAAIVGNTASRKGAGLSVVKWLMQRAEPEWYGNHLGYGLSSGEGLIERVRDDEPTTWFKATLRHPRDQTPALHRAGIRAAYRSRGVRATRSTPTSATPGTGLRSRA